MGWDRMGWERRERKNMKGGEIERDRKNNCVRGDDCTWISP